MDEQLVLTILYAVLIPAIIVLTFGLLLVLWRLAQVLKLVEHVAQSISAETDMVLSDMTYVREIIKKIVHFGSLKKSFKKLQK